MKRIFGNSNLLIAISIFIAITSAAQQPLNQDLLMNKTFGRFLDPESKVGWMKFAKDAPYTGTEIFSQQPELLGLRNEDEMRLMKTSTDAANNNHYRFAQYYKGVRVEMIEQLVHAKKDGRVYLMNGNFVPNLNLDVHPQISSQRAIDIALKTVPAKKYLWEDASQEEHFRQKKNDPQASLYPQPELLIVKGEAKGERIASNYVLAYRVAVFAEVPRVSDYVYVDAKTGELIRTRNLDLNCSPGTATTTYNGTHSVNTTYMTDVSDYTGTEHTGYFSKDDCNSNTVINSWYSDNFSGDYLQYDVDNSWDYLIGASHMTISTLWAVKQAYLYYLNVHNHESFSGGGGLIDAYSNRLYYKDDGTEYCGNANFTSVIDNLNFGAGGDCYAGTNDDYNTDDIVGHEFTHGVIDHAHLDALDYQGESGALNESFADIFGENVEDYVEGSHDFLEAADKSDGAIRSFSSPKDFNDPDTYLGTYWMPVDTDKDNGGVHTNSGVQNHMFYLLSDGGSGTNDLGWSYSVTGIGFDEASAIAYQAMMNYLDGSDGYEIAHNAWIQSAIDLYGSCSQEVVSVGEAFMAVGVTYYTDFNLGSVCGTYTGVATIDGAQEIRNASIIGNNFSSTNCTTSINSGAVITLSSGNIVRLLPGFSAVTGCTLTARIDACEMSDYDPNNLKQSQGDVNETSEQNIIHGFSIYPVPADQSVTVEFSLDESEHVEISVVDVSGREITTWLDDVFPAGKSKVQFRTADLTPGVYMCVIHAGEKVMIEKFVKQ